MQYLRIPIQNSFEYQTLQVFLKPQLGHSHLGNRPNAALNLSTHVRCETSTCFLFAKLPEPERSKNLHSPLLVAPSVVASVFEA